MDIKSIIQAFIIAGVTGLTVMYGTQKSLGVEIRSLRDDVSEVKMAVSDIRKDLYIPRR